VSGVSVHLTGAGTCTITASQAGNANYNAAASVPRSFTITRPAAPPPPPVVKCKVPNVVGKPLAKARTMITKAHCRVGKITKAYSRKRKKDIVIGQSKRPGRIVAKNTKINLIVSRGRRR
jgi:chitinase